MRLHIVVVSLVLVAGAACGDPAPAPAAVQRQREEAPRLTVAGPVGARLVAPKLSPDGRTIAFRTFNRQGQSQIYVRSLSDVEAVPLLAAGEGGPAGGFSPDGRFLLVTDRFDPRIMRRVPLAGGPATPITEGGNVGATWGPQDTIVMGSDEGLWLVPASGGERTPLTTLSDGEQGHWLPSFLPSGRAVLFFILTGDRETGQVGVYDFDTDKRRTLLSGTDPWFAASGHVVFWRDGALWAMRFDPNLLEVSGTPVVVVPEVAADRMGDAMYSVSEEGTLAYIPAQGPSAWAEIIVVQNWHEELKRLVPVD